MAKSCRPPLDFNTQVCVWVCGGGGAGPAAVWDGNSVAWRGVASRRGAILPAVARSLLPPLRCAFKACPAETELAPREPSGGSLRRLAWDRLAVSVGMAHVSAVHCVLTWVGRSALSFSWLEKACRSCRCVPALRRCRAWVPP